MRASSKCFITDERAQGRGRRINLVWHHLQGKAGIAADTVNTTHSIAKIADRDMMLSGANIDSATSSALVEGGKKYTVVAGDTNGVCLEPNTLANGSPWTEIDWATDKEMEWEAHIKVDGTDGANRIFKCGLGLIPSTVDLTTDDDYVGWSWENDYALDYVFNVGGGTDVADSSFYTLLTGDELHLAIKFDKDQFFRSYVNGREMTGVAPKSFVGNQTVLMLPYVAYLEDTDDEEPYIQVFGMSMSQRLE